MSNVTSTANRARKVESSEARHWIERQLRWERTLGELRDHRAGRETAKAA
jgi:hypothetical protein